MLRSCLLLLGSLFICDLTPRVVAEVELNTFVDVKPSPTPPRHLPGFKLIRDRRGVYWWYRSAGSDGMSRGTWAYYVTQFRPSGEGVPLAVVSPDQVVSYNSGLDLAAMASSFQPGFTAGGPPGQSARGSSPAISADPLPDLVLDPVLDPVPDPDQADTQGRRRPTPFEMWLRTFVGVDLVTFYVVVGCFAVGLVASLGVVLLLLLYLFFKR